ncbi:MAG: hypothetical protein GF411_13585 [Candidatus Lokiarchaeota archaeon]|nr:hypothetical protein [Candidatus Lokiarchaeota archaeon]
MMSIDTDEQVNSSMNNILIPLGALVSFLAVLLTLFGPGSISYYLIIAFLENASLLNNIVDALYLTFNAIIALGFYQVYRKYGERFFFLAAVLCGLIIVLSLIAPLFSIPVPITVTIVSVSVKMILNFLFLLLVSIGMLRIQSEWANSNLLSVFSKTIILFAIPRLILQITISLSFLYNEIPDYSLILSTLSGLHSATGLIVFGILTVYFCIEAGWLDSKQISNPVHLMLFFVVFVLGRFLIFIGFIATQIYLVFLSETLITVIIGSILIISALWYILRVLWPKSLTVFYFGGIIVSSVIIALSVLFGYPILYLVTGIVDFVLLLILYKMSGSQNESAII